MCNDSFSKVLAFVGALVTGVVIALLYNQALILDARTLVYVGVAMSAAILVFITLVLFCGHHGWRCICGYASSLLYASVLSILATAVLLAVTPAAATAITLRTTIALGAWGTLTALAVILFLMMLTCIINARCGCGACSTCGGSANACSCQLNGNGNGNCRY